jgi:[ribosomal protein S5]-alanine N-acetyltransferase
VKNKNIIHTDRLLMRPFDMKDFNWLCDLYAKPQVMKYIYDGQIFNQEQTKQRLLNFISEWKENGFGFWVIIEKISGEYVGYSGFRHYEKSEDIELGYILDDCFWGKGYASEIVQNCVSLGFSQYNFQKIMATVVPENIGSIKVLKRAGLDYSNNLIINEIKHHIYQVTNTTIK